MSYNSTTQGQYQELVRSTHERNPKHEVGLLVNKTEQGLVQVYSNMCPCPRPRLSSSPKPLEPQKNMLLKTQHAWYIYVNVLYTYIYTYIGPMRVARQRRMLGWTNKGRRQAPQSKRLLDTANAHWGSRERAERASWRTDLAPRPPGRKTRADARIKADVCWRMLTYADVCWRMLTYADVCWCMLTAPGRRAGARIKDRATLFKVRVLNSWTTRSLDLPTLRYNGGGGRVQRGFCLKKYRMPLDSCMQYLW